MNWRPGQRLATVVGGTLNGQVVPIQDAKVIRFVGEDPGNAWEVYEWEHGPDGIRLVFDCIERAE